MTTTTTQVAQVCRVYPLERGGTHTLPDHGPRVGTQAPHTRYTHTQRQHPHTPYERAHQRAIHTGNATPNTPTTEVGQSVGPGGGVLRGETMRVPTGDRADDYQSVQPPVSAGQTRRVPQSPPSQEASE